MQQNKIIALVGLCGSGKSVAGDYLESIGFHKVYFGGITIEEVKKRNLPVNEENERKVREELRKNHGMAAYAILSMPKIETGISSNKNVLIDGLYSFSEYKILKDKFDDRLIVIAVFTPKKVRYERLANREYRPLTPEQAQSRDFAEIENIEKGGPISIADYTILNSGTEKELVENLKKILTEEGIN